MVDSKIGIDNIICLWLNCTLRNGTRRDSLDAALPDAYRGEGRVGLGAVGAALLVGRCYRHGRGVADGFWDDAESEPAVAIF